MSRPTVNPKPAPVGDYPERPFSKAKAPDEESVKQKDQIEDYHKTHPTLKPNRQHDPEYQEKAQAKVEVREPEQKD